MVDEGVSRNLPLSLSTLIGREEDLAGVTNLVRHARIVTITGPGGAGKSRLAVAVASELTPRYRDGTWFVDAGGVDDAAALQASLAGACGPEREVLVVLDNCEPLASACATVALSIARAGPGVSVLATSRQRLGVPGERLWPLRGLATDGPEPCRRRRMPGISPAVRLFVDRARAQRPDFKLDSDERDVVTALCRRLDGLPFAIELAAGRAGVLSPAEMLVRLDDPFPLLVGGDPTTPPHHRSLAATLDWSHDLLSDAEAVLFRRLAVFVGGFRLAAAEAVCGSPPLHDGTLLETLASLVAKSLVVADTVGDETHYRLLHTTRAYAVDRSASAGEAACLQERHARWSVAYARELRPKLWGPAPDSSMTRLAAEHENMVAALTWAVEAERTEWALELAATMASFWRKECRLSTGREWLATVLALPDQPARLRAEALLGLGTLVGEGGDRASAIGPLEEALRLAEEAGDAGTEARVLGLLGYYRLFCDVPTTALLPLERSTEKALDAGDHRTMLDALASSGWAARFAGDARLAEVRFSRCLLAADRSEGGEGDAWPAVVGLGWAALAQGQFSEADARLTEALTTADRARCRQGQSAAWCFLGQLAQARGNNGATSALLRRSLPYAQETANSFALAMRLALLGSVAHDEADLEAAEAVLLEALAVPGADNLPLAHAQRLLSLGALRISQRRVEEAATLLEESAAVAKDRGLHGMTAAVLVERGRLRRLAGDPQEAARTLSQAIPLADRLGDALVLVDAIEALGGVRASQGRSRTACRLLAAAAAARRESGIARPPVRRAQYEDDVALARTGLSPDEWDALWAGSASLSLAGAAAVAVRRHGRRDSPRTGWDAVTPAEREVVALVAEGLTNREAAARLVVSVRTVESHVAHVRAKLGLASRRELARVASAKGFATPT